MLQYHEDFIFDEEGPRRWPWAEDRGNGWNIGPSRFLVRRIELSRVASRVCDSNFPIILASGFPSLSKRVPYIRIHHLVFFVLKHFGTGALRATNSQWSYYGFDHRAT